MASITAMFYSLSQMLPAIKHVVSDMIVFQQDKTLHLIVQGYH